MTNTPKHSNPLTIGTTSTGITTSAVVFSKPNPTNPIGIGRDAVIPVELTKNQCADCQDWFYPEELTRIYQHGRVCWNCINYMTELD